MTVTYLALFVAATLGFVLLISSGNGTPFTVNAVSSSPLIVFLFLFVYFARNQHVPRDIVETRRGAAGGADVNPTDNPASDGPGNRMRGGSEDGLSDGFKGGDGFNSGIEEGVDEPGISKYVRSGLSENEIENKYSNLVREIRESKLYLESDISLAALAERVNVSRHHLSQIINTKTDGNFYAFINGFRIQEFLKSADAGTHRRKTLVGMALDAGFNSYSTFYYTFKKFVGTTPRNYLLKLSEKQPA